MNHLRRSLRGRSALLNVFELWVALAGIISGLVYFFDSASLDANAISKQIGFTLAVIWNISYFFSGIAVGYGLLRPSPRIEIAGLCMLGGTTAVNGVSIFAVFGGRGAATAITLITLTMAAWARAYIVYNAAVKLAEEWADARR